jgi:hypothetical protein
MPLEDIADLVGHKGTVTTETVYWKVIVPELRRGSEVMDRLFSWHEHTIEPSALHLDACVIWA